MKRFMILVALIMAFAGCENLKKQCKIHLSGLLDDFAVNMAEACDGDVAVSKAYFAEVPTKICGKPEANAVFNPEKDALAMTALCGLIADTVTYGGQKYLENAIRCKKPLPLKFISDSLKTMVCNSL